MPSSTVPDHLVQIKALRADIAFTGEKETTRWLGFQGGKYVSLPTEWVILNFFTSALDEATRRARMVIKGSKKNMTANLYLCLLETREMTTHRSVFATTRD
jgi:hypothetical protein